MRKSQRLNKINPKHKIRSTSQRKNNFSLYSSSRGLPSRRTQLISQTTCSGLVWRSLLRRGGVQWRVIRSKRRARSVRVSLGCQREWGVLCRWRRRGRRWGRRIRVHKGLIRRVNSQAQ